MDIIIQSIEYSLYVPIRLRKERVFLNRLDDRNIPYDSSDIYSASVGVGITVSSDTLKELDISIEAYIKLLKKCTNGILEK